jgi:2-polyprenyl-6-methoxyphenol hydroxylase-like FAD-dependent oxidoreductase
MRIRVIGGGPAGLYFATLARRLSPAPDVEVHERGPRDATWGFGVVFSDRALEFLRADDEDLYQALMPLAQTWSDLTVAHNDTRVAVAGNGFAAIGRLELLQLLQARAEAAGVRLVFGSEVSSLDALAPADLVVVANGAFSSVRAAHEARFGTQTEWRSNRFIWYGTPQLFDTLTLTFRQTPQGVFCAHHYRYSPRMSTFLVEVEDATWRRCGFETMGEDETRAHCERVFARELGGRPVLSNRSVWRQFPAIRNEHWHVDRMVLIGDALRTAHFSIGSGTRLAMEDAVALYKALRDTPSVDAALGQFQALRQPPMRKIWDAANVSLRWYEQMDERVGSLSPVEFAYSYMTRTGRVGHAEVRRRDPRLAAAYEALHPELADRGRPD